MSKSLIQQAIENDKTDERTVEMIRGAAVKLGRAISLSVVAATASPRVEAHAIASADVAWVELADSVIEFALEDD